MLVGSLAFESRWHARVGNAGESCGLVSKIMVWWACENAAVVDEIPQDNVMSWSVVVCACCGRPAARGVVLMCCCYLSNPWVMS